MRVRVHDFDVLRSLRPLDITSYLRASGWSVQDASGGESLVPWARDSDRGHVEVYVPKNQTWRDYARRMREVVARLAEVEGRSELQIVNDIPLTTKDIIRVRAVPEGRSEDSISLGDGVQLVRFGRGMLLAAACAAHERRSAFHARKPKPATDYLENVRMGQTERGSFIVTLYSPVPPALTKQQAFEFLEHHPESEPFARRVTRTLSTALEAVRDAADRGMATGTLDAFETAIQAGVSADLCEALALTRECRAITELEVGIAWAPARPMPENLRRRHSFTPDAIDVIQEAGRLLRATTPEADFELSGPVVEVSRPAEELHGTAVIYGSVAGRPRKVRVEVRDADWELANKAMVNRQILRCTGELAREGNGFVLRNARDVREELAEDDE